MESQLASCTQNIDLYNTIESKVEWGLLYFNFEQGLPEHQRPAFVVDGQHRLRGIADIKNENIPIMVAALINASHEEQAFQFVVINNKSAKVPTDNVKAIISRVDENELRDRLLNVRVSYGGIPAILRDVDSEQDSPFRGLLDWPLNSEKNRRVKLNTIEACLDYIEDKLPVLEEDEDTRRELFYAVWQVVTSYYQNLWLKNDRFMYKVSINALNEFIVDRIAYAWEGSIIDVFDPVSIENQTKNILKLVPEEFWTQSWSSQIRIQDNAIIRDLIKSELGMISQNSRMGKGNVFEKSRLIVDEQVTDLENE